MRDWNINMTFEFKHVRELKCFLVANIKRKCKVGGLFTFGSNTYIRKIFDNYQSIGDLPKRSNYSMESGDYLKSNGVNV